MGLISENVSITIQSRCACFYTMPWGLDRTMRFNGLVHGVYRPKLECSIFVTCVARA